MTQVKKLNTRSLRKRHQFRFVYQSVVQPTGHIHACFDGTFDRFQPVRWQIAPGIGNTRHQRFRSARFGAGNIHSFQPKDQVLKPLFHAF